MEKLLFLLYTTEKILRTLRNRKTTPITKKIILKENGIYE
jgi:hypothetical protein